MFYFNGTRVTGVKLTTVPVDVKGTKEVTENGEHNVAAFEKVNVNVPVPKNSGNIHISDNGTHSVDGYAFAVVDVPTPKIEGSIELTENGTHNIAGYAEAVVNVAIPEIKDGNIIDVVSLPTSDIDEEAIYRVLNAAFFDGKKFRNNAFCEVVEWGAKPSSAGEEAFQMIDGVSTNISYYDAKTGTIWCYFGDGSRQVLSDMIDAREDLSSFEKDLAKAALYLLSGWMTKEEIVKIAGDRISVPGGKVISSLDEVTSVDEEYLLLYYDMFVYENGEWINLDSIDEYIGGLVDNIKTTVDNIIALQESLIGGDSV